MPRHVFTAALLGSFSALALSACAGLPVDAPASQAKSASDYSTERSFSAAPADWPTDRWWTAYGDAQLTGLIDEALAMVDIEPAANPSSRNTSCATSRIASRRASGSRRGFAGGVIKNSPNRTVRSA